MRSTIDWLLVGMFMLAAGGTAWGAQQPNPSLTALDSGVEDQHAKSFALDISDLDVVVDIVGNVARTTVAARFTNSSRDDLEGTFSLQMPTDAVVTGYALDVDGRMIDGVLVPPARAHRAYEEKLRRGIDPGVAEVRRGNVFSTRVYPILADKGRTIRLTFVSPVHGEGGFTLPLASLKRAGRVALTVRVRNADAPPEVRWPVKGEFAWRTKGEALVSELVLRSQSFAGDLHVGALPTNGLAFVTRHPAGTRFVELRDSVTGALPAMTPPRSARIYWDRSTSRRDDDLAGELTLLERYLTATGMTKIEVISFNSSGAKSQVVKDAASAAAAIRVLEYRGATSFSALASASRLPAEVCLLFSDGVPTVDARPELQLGCPLFAIATARDADRGYLAQLARLNGGALLPSGASLDESLSRLRQPAPRVVEVRSSDGRALRFAPLDAGGRGWALVAQAPASGDLLVRIAGIGAGVIERRYALRETRGEFAGAGALWAGNRVFQIAGDGRKERELQDISRRYSIASPAMAFVVLETPDDYLDAKVEPPRNYPAEALAEYRAGRAERERDERERRAKWLDQLVDNWTEQKEWWEEEFEPDAHAKHKEREAKSLSAAPVAAAPANGTIDSITAEDIGTFPDSRPAEALQRMQGITVTNAESLESVVVTGMRASGPEIAVELEPWSPDRPYLHALDAAGLANFSRAFAAQERRNGAMPVFYLDVAEWLFRKQRKAEAVEMLLSALELPARDTETIALVADRLMRYGQLGRAIWLYEEVCRLDPDRPQPARKLAQAFEQRALTPHARDPRRDLERALTLLETVIMAPSDGDYEGIELVSLMDANEIIARLRALGSHKFSLDPRLVTMLDVDLRVVIEWNTGASDMDLWVDQPDGERSIYSNPETDIGGRLSNDMTSGYGPEEYLLRRAIDGEYAVSVNVYATDVINPNGSTMVTAHLTRNFGRANQSSETMELELKPDETGEKLVGRFNVGARTGLSQR